METLLMGRRFCYVLCLIFIYYSQQSSCATIEVGGPVGWTNFDTSTNKPPDYATWVSSQSVIVDDILVFKFPPGYHNVYSLPTQAAYTSCDQSKATELNDGKTGSYSWTATKAGTYYFACFKVVEGLGSHCQGGQKLEVVVKGGKAAAPAPVPAPAPAKKAPALAPSSSEAPTSVVGVPAPAPSPGPSKGAGGLSSTPAWTAIFILSALVVLGI